jgi:hypothetical protein
MRVLSLALRMMYVVLPLAGTFACGRYVSSNDPQDASIDQVVVDAGSDASLSTVDATVRDSAGACDLSAPFGSLVKLDTVSDTLRNEWSAWISDDELTMAFTRQDNDGQKNLLARRKVRTSSFVQGVPIETDRSLERNAGPTVITAPGVVNGTYVFASFGSVWTLYKAPIAIDTFAVGATASILTLPENAQLPAFASPTELYFIRGDYLGAGGKLYKTSLQGGPPPRDVPEINALFDSIGNVTFSSDGLTLYFGAKQFGTPTDYDIYTATRPSLTALFDSPSRVDELATPEADFEVPLKISVDGCRIYVSANRKGSSIDIYMASKPR